VSNPLDAGAGNNIVSKLFTNITPGPMNGIKVYVFDDASGGYFPVAAWSPVPGVGFGATGGNLAVPVGAGAFVYNPDPTGTAARTLTFVGEVMQGTLNNTLPPGYSIRANMVPQAGAPNTFGLPGTIGDKFYRFNTATGGYDGSFFGNPPPAQWRPALPNIAVGEAFFFYNGSPSKVWTRTFNVNNPS